MLSVLCNKTIYFFVFCIQGKNQVAVGLAPIDFANKSSESALSIYPIAIGNCKENRSVTTDCAIMNKFKVF